MNSKLAVVTGAGRGVGAAIAKKLSQNGYTVLLLARAETELNRVAQNIKAEGGKAHTLAIDLTKENDLDKAAAFVDAFDGKLSLLVHNAGIAKIGKIEETSLKDWRETLDINLTAPFLLTQKLIGKMESGSQIIFINSIAGKQAFPEWGAYSVSKFGLKAFADTLRREVQNKGVRVTTIYPSSVDTSLHDSLPYDWDRSKMLKTDDVANAVLYCIKQSANVQINEIEMENMAGHF